MPLAWWLKAAFKAIVLPPTGPILIIVMGLVFSRRRPGLGRALAWIGCATLLALCVPVVSSALIALDRPPRAFTLSDAGGAQAIVILGGGVREDAPEYGGDTLGRLTLDRVRYGARVAKLTGLPVLVSGGKPNERTTAEAVVMREALEHEFGVPVRWLEDRSINTRENAELSTRMLRADGIGRILLVAHGFDIRRASAEFAAEGMSVVPAATDLSADRPATAGDWLPSAAGLQASYYALYEFFGYLALRVREAIRLG